MLNHEFNKQTLIGAFISTPNTSLAFWNEHLWPIHKIALFLQKIKKMQLTLLKHWLISTCLTFAIYEILWRLLGSAAFPFDGYIELLVDFSYCGLFSLTSITISHFLNKIHFFRRFTAPRQMLFCLSTLILNMIVAFVFEKVYNIFCPAPSNEFFWNSLYIFCFIATLFSLIYTTYHYCIIVIRQKDELATLQKKILKSNLDPHFVFNSLSILAELIHQNPIQAEKYVIRLSRTYRYLLSHLEQDYAAIDESIDFIKDYIALQEMRLDGKIELSINLQDLQADSKIFPMALQLLIENAIKHNCPSQGETLHIDINATGSHIVVRNSLKNTNRLVKSYGIGLESLRKRYLMEGMPAPTITYNGEWYEVSLPVLKPIHNK